MFEGEEIETKKTVAWLPASAPSLAIQNSMKTKKVCKKTFLGVFFFIVHFYININNNELEFFFVSLFYSS